ncbi:MAG: iron ABC transporter permease [Lachnospiraceae bacterium]|nr:iron ABC transporter permease [Lachnospiraceae bacterium]
MFNKENFKYIVCYIILIAALVVLGLVNLAAGSVDISISDVFAAFSGEGGKSAYIITDIRLPRVFAALLLGGALSVAGFLLQTFFANPIAGPFVLGISSGAKLFVALTMIFLLQYGIQINSFGMITAAFCGSMAAMGIILLMSAKVKSMSILIICGIMIGYICTAVTDFIVTFAEDSNIVNLHYWSLGSFSGITWDNIKVISVIVLVCLVCSFLLSKPISAYQLGEGYAKSMGLNITVFRIELILLSSLMSALVAAFAGPVSFVGIAVPHLVKTLFKSSRPLIVIPGIFLGGGVFCLFADLIARVVFAPLELSISSVTAIMGAPIVIFIMLKERRKAG